MFPGMPRQKRNLKNNHYYHLVNRGVAKQPTYLDEYDFSEFIRLLLKGCEKHPMDIVAFSLMPNHYHLLIQAVEGESVSKSMHWAMGMYARYFNKRYDRVGHLWQNRFFSREIMDGRQLGATWMYVEQNPVRAELVEKPEDWKWSSAYLRSMGNSVHGLVEPYWWGTPKAKDWWSNESLDEKTLNKVRRSLQRKILDSEVNWD